MNTAKFTYNKKDGTESSRLILGAKIVKDLKNDIPFLDHQDAKYLTGWEIDTQGMSEDVISNYTETVKDFFYEINRLENYLRESGLDPSKVKYKTFSKDSIKNILLF